MPSTGGRYRVAAPAVLPAGQVQASRPGNRRARQQVWLASAAGTPRQLQAVRQGQALARWCLTRGWRAKGWPSSSSWAPAGPPAGQASGSLGRQRGAGAGRPSWAAGARAGLGCAPVGRAGASSRNAHYNPRPAGERRGAAVLSRGAAGSVTAGGCWSGQAPARWRGWRWSPTCSSGA